MSCDEQVERPKLHVSNVIEYVVCHGSKIEFVDHNEQVHLACMAKHVLQGKGERVIVRVAVTLHGMFKEEWRDYYSPDVDHVFVHFTNMVNNGSVEYMTSYIDQLCKICNIDEHLVDIDQYIKKFGEEIQCKLKTEENKKKQLELRQQIMEQQLAVRKAVVMMFGDVSKYKKMHLRQLRLLYQAHATCFKLLQHLVEVEEIVEWSYKNFKVPSCWFAVDEMGPFEEYLKHKWGVRLKQLLGINPARFVWWPKECVNQETKMVACRKLPQVGDVVLDVGRGGFFAELSDVQCGQWEVMTLSQPPLLDHSILRTSTWQMHSTRTATGCKCKRCMIWAEPSLAPWFLMWQRTFGLRLLDLLVQQHSKLSNPKSDNSRGGSRGRHHQPVTADSRDRDQLINMMRDTSQALRQAQQLDDAPQTYHIVSNLETFLFDPRVIMLLPWSPTLLQQWLSAAFTCVLQFESASVELRHWGMTCDIAKLSLNVLVMLSDVKQSLLLALHMLCRQVIDFPNTDAHDLYPGVIMDQVLCTLPVLEWLTSGQAGELLQHIRAQVLSVKPQDKKYYLSTSSYTMHHTLQHNYTQHYWHVMFWLQGKKEVLPPISDVPLDLETLLEELNEQRKIYITTKCMKPLGKEEQDIFRLCVMPTLPADDDTRAGHYVSCAQQVLATLHSSGVFTKKAYKAAVNLVNMKATKTAAREIQGYCDELDALGHLLVCSAIFCSLTSALAGLDQHESMLSSVVFLSGETLLREQLARVASASTLLTGITSSPQISLDLQQTTSTYVPFWRIHLPPQPKLRCKNGVAFYSHMQRQIYMVHTHRVLLDRDLFWKCVSKTPYETESKIQNVLLLYDNLDHIIVAICRNNLAKWEQGEDMFPSLLEVCYWPASLMSLIVNYLQSYNDTSDDSSSDSEVLNSDSDSSFQTISEYSMGSTSVSEVADILCHVTIGDSDSTNGVLYLDNNQVQRPIAAVRNKKNTANHDTAHASNLCEFHQDPVNRGKHGDSIHECSHETSASVSASEGGSSEQSDTAQHCNNAAGHAQCCTHEPTSGTQVETHPTSQKPCSQAHNLKQQSNKDTSNNAAVPIQPGTRPVPSKRQKTKIESSHVIEPSKVLSKKPLESGAHNCDKAAAPVPPCKEQLCSGTEKTDRHLTQTKQNIARTNEGENLEATECTSATLPAQSSEKQKTAANTNETSNNNSQFLNDTGTNLKPSNQANTRNKKAFIQLFGQKLKSSNAGSKENQCKINNINNGNNSSDKPTEGKVINNNATTQTVTKTMTRKQRLRERRKALSNVTTNNTPVTVKKQTRNVEVVQPVDDEHRAELRRRLRALKAGLRNPHTCTCHHYHPAASHHEHDHGQEEPCDHSEDTCHHHDDNVCSDDSCDQEEEAEVKKSRRSKKREERKLRNKDKKKHLEEAERIKREEEERELQIIRHTVWGVVYSLLQTRCDFTHFVSWLKIRRCFTFLNLLLTSYKEDYIMWGQSGECGRQQGLAKLSYDKWVKQCDVTQARCDAVSTQYYLGRTWDLLKTYVGYQHNAHAYGVEEPIRGYMNFNNNMLSYVDGKKASYLDKSPALHRMLLDVSSQLMLPLARRLFHLMVQACSPTAPGVVECAPHSAQLSTLHLAGQALLVFKLMIDTQPLSQPSKTNTMWKYLPTLCEGILVCLEMSEDRKEETPEELLEAMPSFVYRCVSFLSVYLKQAQEEAKKLNKPVLELSSELRALLSAHTPHFNLVVTMFQHSQFDLLASVLALVPPDTTNYVAVKREAKSKDVHWCRKCLKLEPRSKKGSFLACEECTGPDKVYFCSTQCQGEMQHVHHIEHLHLMLSQVHLLP